MVGYIKNIQNATDPKNIKLELLYLAPVTLQLEYNDQFCVLHPKKDEDKLRIYRSRETKIRILKSKLHEETR